MPTVPSKPTRTPTRTQVVVPVISFSDQTIEFRRHALALKATITPKGPIQFRVLRGGAGTNHDDQCHIVDGRLELWKPLVPAEDRDLVPPDLFTACIIEAFAPAAPGRAAATRRQALVKVGYPTFDLSVVPVPTVDWSALESKSVTVTIREDSGAAYQMYVDRVGEGSAKCTVSFNNDTSAPDTRRYEIRVELADPGSESYTCSLQARAGPVSIAGSSKAAPFTITVIP